MYETIVYDGGALLAGVGWTGVFMDIVSIDQIDRHWKRMAVPPEAQASCQLEDLHHEDADYGDAFLGRQFDQVRCEAIREAPYLALLHSDHAFAYFSASYMRCFVTECSGDKHKKLAWAQTLEQWLIALHAKLTRENTARFGIFLDLLNCDQVQDIQSFLNNLQLDKELLFDEPMFEVLSRSATILSLKTKPLE